MAKVNFDGKIMAVMGWLTRPHALPSQVKLTTIDEGVEIQLRSGFDILLLCLPLICALNGAYLVCHSEVRP